MYINNAMLAEMHWIKTSPYSSATEKTQFLEVFNELNKNLSHDLLPKVEDTKENSKYVMIPEKNQRWNWWD